MAKQSNQKLKLLYLLKILLEQTDETSGLTLSQISAELLKYNVGAARKSLYDDIESLRHFGVDVCVKRDRYVRYYIQRRELSFIELKYIVDSLESFNALEFEACRELVDKLIKIFGVRNRLYHNEREEPFYKTPRVIQEENSNSVEALSVAIQGRKKISCKEFTWNTSKQRMVKNEGARISLTPICLFYEGRYKLLAYNGQVVSEFFVDRLLDVIVENEAAAQEMEYREQLAKWQETQIYENVRLECANEFAGEIFSHFGLGVTVLSKKEKSFEISAKVKSNDEFFAWLFANSKHVRINSPERVLDEYRNRVLMALDNIK